MEYRTILRNLRTDNDLSQEVVAKYIGVSQRTYSDYEAGNLKVPIETLISLAKYYNVDLNYITGISPIKSPFPSEHK